MLSAAPHAWAWSALVLRRSADALALVATDGEARHLDLAFRGPAPEPGKAIERLLTTEEIDALADTFAAGVSSMLLALSIECLLKALLAKAGAQLVDSAGVLRPEFKTHQLRVLATKAGLAFLPADMRILDWLSSFLYWRGRYPIPAKWEQLSEFVGVKIDNISEARKRGFQLADAIRNQLDAAQRINGDPPAA